MTPPQTSPIGPNANGNASAAVLSCPKLIVLTQRRDFQRAARGKRVAQAGFVLQMLRRPAEADQTSPHIGIRLVLPDQGHAGHDYVLIGRKTATATLPFTQLTGELEKALRILHGPRQ